MNETVQIVLSWSNTVPNGGFCESGNELCTMNLALKVRPHRTRSAAADCGLCPLRNVTF